MTNGGNHHFFNAAHLTIGVLGLLAAVVGAGIAFVQGWPPVLFGKKTIFSANFAQILSGEVKFGL